jgi:hypothetical protein
MRYFVFPGLAILICVSISSAQSGQQSKKSEPLAILASSQFVFVEAYDGPNSPGPVHDPLVRPEDREAVENVQTAIRNWGYYILTLRRSEADLVVFVRKGRTANSSGAGRASSDPSPAQKPETGLVAPADAATNMDLLCVYSRKPSGTLYGPLWQKSLKDGLSTPKMVLFKDFKNDVITRAPLQAEKNIS